MTVPMRPSALASAMMGASMEGSGALAGITAHELAATLAAQAVGARRELAGARADTLTRLLALAGYRDDNTYEHTQRVGDLAARLAERLGRPPEEVELIRAAAPLHDIGKMAIPDSILLKPGTLTAEEFEVVKTHAALGARVLEGADAFATAARDRPPPPRALGRQRLSRRAGRGGDPARRAARARRRRVRRARARAAVPRVVHGRRGGRGDRPRGWTAVRSPDRSSLLRADLKQPHCRSDGDLPITEAVNPRIRTFLVVPCLLAVLCLAAPAQAATSWGSMASAFSALSCGGAVGDPATGAVDTTATPPTGWQTANVM